MNILEDRKLYSTKKLNEIRVEISKLPYIQKFIDYLCIYATGSFAREEASIHSDIDIFLIINGSETIGDTDKKLIIEDLTKIIRNLKLPEFSGEGEYFIFHNVEQIIEKLGSPEDDSENYFTARMLLLLESKPLFNDKVYKEVITKIIKVYFTDYPEHQKDFTPLFLANDIIRYWKTLCLNYENKRNRRGLETIAKSKSALKNFKLKFSRLTTCYSLLCCFKGNHKDTPENLFELIQLTPIDRLSFVSNEFNSAKLIVQDMLSLYGYFLEITGKDPDDLYDWFSIRDNKVNAFKKANEYHDLFYNLLKLTSENLLKYYTI